MPTYLRTGLVLVVLILALGVCDSKGFAQTDPYEHPHPTTGEPGVWVPVWLQRVELKRKADLTVCQASTQLQADALAARVAEVEALRSANLEVTEAVEGLKEYGAALGVQREQTEKKAARRWVWAWTSTGAAVVAILSLVLVSAL
jgi:hypothetical protein